jgi:SAM-dependent methyltransferase
VRWLAKAALQNTISVLPKGVEANGLLQRYGTRSVVMTPERVVSKLARVGGRHVDHQRRFGARPLAETEVVEIGTGFAPLLPVGLHLAGARAVHTFDIVRLTNTARTVDMLTHLIAAADSGALARECPWVLPERLDRARALAADPPLDLDALLAEMGISYHVGDASRSGLAEESAGLFVTNNVFEHVPADGIRALLREAHRTGAPGALISHHVDLRDHYAKFDRKVGVYNSLRFSSRRWRYLNSRMEPQNRLRRPDYLDIVAECGFDVVAEHSYNGADAHFAAVRPAPEFRRYDEADLRIVDMWVAARRRD